MLRPLKFVKEWKLLTSSIDLVIYCTDMIDSCTKEIQTLGFHKDLFLLQQHQTHLSQWQKRTVNIDQWAPQCVSDQLRQEYRHILYIFFYLKTRSFGQLGLTDITSTVTNDSRFRVSANQSWTDEHPDHMARKWKQEWIKCGNFWRCCIQVVGNLMRLRTFEKIK